MATALFFSWDKVEATTDTSTLSFKTFRGSIWKSYYTNLGGGDSHVLRVSLAPCLLEAGLAPLENSGMVAGIQSVDMWQSYAWVVWTCEIQLPVEGGGQQTASFFFLLKKALIESRATWRTFLVVSLLVFFLELNKSLRKWQLPPSPYLYF